MQRYTYSDIMAFIKVSKRTSWNEGVKEVSVNVRVGRPNDSSYAMREVEQQLYSSTPQRRDIPRLSPGGSYEQLMERCGAGIVSEVVDDHYPAIGYIHRPALDELGPKVDPIEVEIIGEFDDLQQEFSPHGSLRTLADVVSPRGKGEIPFSRFFGVAAKHLDNALGESAADFEETGGEKLGNPTVSPGTAYVQAPRQTI